MSMSAGKPRFRDALDAQPTDTEQTTGAELRFRFNGEMTMCLGARMGDAGH